MRNSAQVCNNVCFAARATQYIFRYFGGSNDRAMWAAY